jgi:uncharacterized protein (DUF433 family)
MTRGNHYNINCPHCSKNNSYVTQGVTVPFRSVVYFTKECHYCKQKIEYSASWEIALQAERFPGTFSKVSGRTLIEINTDRMSGKPVLVGTRLTIAQLIAELAEGEFNFKELCQSFSLPFDKTMEALHQVASSMNGGFGHNREDIVTTETQAPDIQ